MNDPADEWTSVVPGIPDGRFATGNLPMTKQEVRVVSLSKLRPERSHTIWDIGAGTGSVAVEAARLVPDGTVHAVEKSEDGVERIRTNRDRFGVASLSVVHGEAPEILDRLPDPDRVFVGGTGGRLEEILEVSYDRLTNEGRLVLNAVTMDTITAGFQALSDLPFQIDDICSVAIHRSEDVAGYHFMKSRNQVYVMTARKEEGNGS